MELTLVLAALVVACIVLTVRVGRFSARCWAAAGLCALIASASWGTRDLSSDAALVAALPARIAENEFVSSSTCRSCHPGEYHSWHSSFHHTMTQPATVESVRGDFDGVVLQKFGYTCRLERRGDEFWIDMTDPLWFEKPTSEPGTTPPRITVRIVMCTGSHHLQTYWVRRPKDKQAFRRPDDGALMQIPWVWMIEEARWVATEDSFLGPPLDRPEDLLPWNTSCNMCHSVGTQPHLQRTKFESRTAELGIACEACHGPGAEHVRANRSPLTRYQKHLAGGDAGDSTIINPARLNKQRSAEVCGQCHSFNKELDMKRWIKTGVAYRAGDELALTKAVFKYTENPTHPRLLEHLKADPQALHGRFWKDGTIRVAGREYNGLIESACHLKGEMTCLSCHSMHDYKTPKDQLTRGRHDDRSCIDCHADVAKNIPAHTHHGPDSPGSSCVNCHMPHTTLGLLVAMRSHRIDSPSAANTAKTGRPNACNICHLDRTLEWTANTLTDWYGHQPVKLTNRQRKVAASIVWLIKGDAAQRAIGAWAMGWEPAQQASGRTWQGALLSQSLTDPYSVIRQIAYKSLKSLPGYDGFQFDFIAPKPRRIKKVEESLARWRGNGGRAPDRHGSHLLLDDKGKIDVKRFNRLMSFRDNTPLRIIE